jgi:Bacterial self-protective colicin-like immunity
MSGFKQEYASMMQELMKGTITTTDFVTAYLNKFKSETRELDEVEFGILDELFGDIDAYTSDTNLIAENPNFYIDENQLRERVVMAKTKLK